MRVAVEIRCYHMYACRLISVFWTAILKLRFLSIYTSQYHEELSWIRRPWKYGGSRRKFAVILYSYRVKSISGLRTTIINLLNFRFLLVLLHYNNVTYVSSSFELLDLKNIRELSHWKIAAIVYTCWVISIFGFWAAILNFCSLHASHNIKNVSVKFLELKIWS